MNGMDLGPSKKREKFPKKGPLRVGYVWDYLPGDDKSLKQQMAGMKDCDIIFKEKSGWVPVEEDYLRKEYRKMRDFVQEGDTVVIYDFEQLSLSLPAAIRDAFSFIRWGKKLSVLAYGIDGSDTGKLAGALTGLSNAEATAFYPRKRQEEYFKAAIG